MTVRNNLAVGGGGGVAQTTCCVNVTSTVTFRNTIIAGNIGPSGADCSGTLTSEGFNLIQDTTGCTIGGDTTDNVIGQAPLLGPLQVNGGHTATHALLEGSPAIDAGNEAVPGSGGTACAATDQRGVGRPRDGNADFIRRCDIGAFER